MYMFYLHQCSFVALSQEEFAFVLITPDSQRVREKNMYIETCPSQGGELTLPWFSPPTMDIQGFPLLLLGDFAFFCALE